MQQMFSQTSKKKLAFLGICIAHTGLKRVEPQRLGTFLYLSQKIDGPSISVFKQSLILSDGSFCLLLK